jgi:hypothetical protein
MCLDMPNDQTLSRKFADQLATAKAHIWRELGARGLHERDGWRIAELVRESPLGGTEVVLRPLHLTLESPADLECVVTIVEEAKTIDLECTTPHPAH